MTTQAEQIDKRLADMPKLYRNIYKTAMKGRSGKAAIRAFCLECVCWQREEVKLCTSLACPLYEYRLRYSGLDTPYKDRLKAVESTKAPNT